jgi:hypothetical protein
VGRGAVLEHQVPDRLLFTAIKVRRSGVSEVYIDTSKGKDVLDVPVPAPLAAGVAPEAAPAVSTPERRSNAEEFGQAAKSLRNRARRSA